MTSEKKKALTPIESLFQEYVVPFSYPVNWKLFDQFKLKKYPAKESYEATVYFGYLASWQSFYTKKRKLQKGGYFFRSVDDVTDDITEYKKEMAELGVNLHIFNILQSDRSKDKTQNTNPQNNTDNY